MAGRAALDFVALLDRYAFPISAVVEDGYLDCDNFDASLSAEEELVIVASRTDSVVVGKQGKTELIMPANYKAKFRDGTTNQELDGIRAVVALGLPRYVHFLPQDEQPSHIELGTIRVERKLMVTEAEDRTYILANLNSLNLELPVTLPAKLRPMGPNKAKASRSAHSSMLASMKIYSGMDSTSIQTIGQYERLGNYGDYDNIQDIPLPAIPSGKSGSGSGKKGLSAATGPPPPCRPSRSASQRSNGAPANEGATAWVCGSCQFTSRYNPLECEQCEAPNPNAPSSPYSAISSQTAYEGTPTAAAGPAIATDDMYLDVGSATEQLAATHMSAPAGAPSSSTLEPALLAFLDERGVRDKCEATLADNEIDSLEALRELTKQDMLDIGLKIGTVVKLQKP